MSIQMGVLHKPDPTGTGNEEVIMGCLGTIRPINISSGLVGQALSIVLMYCTYFGPGQPVVCRVRMR